MMKREILIIFLTSPIVYEKFWLIIGATVTEHDREMNRLNL